MIDADDWPRVANDDDDDRKGRGVMEEAYGGRHIVVVS